MGREYILGPNDSLAGLPSERLVRIAFGLDEFHGHEGLYSLTKKGMNIGGDNGHIQIINMMEGESNLVMGRFDFFGFPYILSLISGQEYKHHGDLQMVHRVRRHVYSAWTNKRKAARSHIVEWDWR